MGKNNVIYLWEELQAFLRRDPRCEIETIEKDTLTIRCLKKEAFSDIYIIGSIFGKLLFPDCSLFLVKASLRDGEPPDDKKVYAFHVNLPTGLTYRGKIIVKRMKEYTETERKHWDISLESRQCPYRTHVEGVPHPFCTSRYKIAHAPKCVIDNCVYNDTGRKNLLAEKENQYKKWSEDQEKKNAMSRFSYGLLTDDDIKRQMEYDDEGDITDE